MKRWMKKLFSITTRSAAFEKFVDLVEQVPARSGRILPVLTYHRIGYPEQPSSLYPGLISASPEGFEAQMAYLTSRFQPISSADLLKMRENGSTLPEKAILVTFDDAYSDFAEYAWPTLKHYHLPVTLFVPTAFPDHPERSFWWDRLSVILEYGAKFGHVDTPIGSFPTTEASQRNATYKKLRDYFGNLPLSETLSLIKRMSEQVGAPESTNAVLSWQALKKLAEEGVTLGPHTQTHPVLHCSTPGEVEAEVAGSIEDLKREIGEVLPVFAYPGGGFNQSVVEILRSEGIKLAFTTVRGVNDLKDPEWLALKRINVGQASNLPVLRAQLSPIYAQFTLRSGGSFS